MDLRFEEYLVLDLGFDLETITSSEVINALSQFNKK